jgi:hypothetical protein
LAGLLGLRNNSSLKEARVLGLSGHNAAAMGNSKSVSEKRAELTVLRERAKAPEATRCAP